MPESMEAEASISSVNTNILDALIKGDEAKFEIKEVVVEDGKDIVVYHTMKGSFDFEGDTTKIKEAKKGKITTFILNSIQKRLMVKRLHL